MKALLAVTLVLVACSSPPQLRPQPGVSRSVVTSIITEVAPPPARSAPTASVRRKVVPLAPDEPTRPPRPILFEAKGNVDGSPGDEAITLYGDGLLAAGAAHGDATVRSFDPAFAPQVSLRAVLIDKASGLRGVLLTQPTEQGEGGPHHHQLFVVSGEMLERVLDTVIGTYGGPELRFPGDGSLRYIEDGFAACDRAQYPAFAVRRDEVSYRLEGAMMREAKRRPTTLKQRCYQRGC